MLLCFSLGQGIIVILAGVFTSFLKGLRNWNTSKEENKIGPPHLFGKNSPTVELILNPSIFFANDFSL